MNKLSFLAAFVVAWSEASPDLAPLYEQRAMSVPLVLLKSSADAAETYWIQHAYGESVVQQANEAGVFIVFMYFPTQSSCRRGTTGV